MTANALLLWMSARQQGSWQQFRAAVEELHVDRDSLAEGDEDDAVDPYALPLYQTLRFNLQRFGHAEFFAGACDADWRVTPPSLAITQVADGYLGIVAGARSPALMQSVSTVTARVESRRKSYPGYPDQICLGAADEHSLLDIAARAGLIAQRDAPAALLACLPPVDDLQVRRPTPLPIGTGWKVDRFCPNTLRWVESAMSDANAAYGSLFRFTLRHQQLVLYCDRGTSAAIPGQVGKYLVLRRRRRHVLRYDADSRALTVSANCRPPFLVERALLLCSGIPPLHVGKGRDAAIRYVEITEQIARSAAALLRQELR